MAKLNKRFGIKLVIIGIGSLIMYLLISLLNLDNINNFLYFIILSIILIISGAIIMRHEKKNIYRRKNKH